MTIQTSYSQTGEHVFLNRIDPANMSYILKAGTYVVCFDADRGIFFLQQKAMKENTGKIYGNVVGRSSRIVDTYLSRPNGNTGVLLSGLRGTGKTVLARKVCDEMVARGGVVILLQNPFTGSGFNSFITSIKQPAVILVDEFEKIYNEEEEQQALLSLMDGVESDSKLWMLTVNSTDIDDCLFNRPSRIFYHFKYDALDPELVREICVDKNFPQDKTDELLNSYNVLLEPTFDVIMSVIEECNRYEMMPLEALKDLNVLSIDPRFINNGATLTVIVDGKSMFGCNVDIHCALTELKAIHIERDEVRRCREDFIKFMKIHPDFENLRIRNSSDEKTVLSDAKIWEDMFYELRTISVEFEGVDKTGSYLMSIPNMENAYVRVKPLPPKKWSAF